LSSKSDPKFDLFYLSHKVKECLISSGGNIDCPEFDLIYRSNSKKFSKIQLKKAVLKGVSLYKGE